MDSPLSSWVPASAALREVPFLTQLNVRTRTALSAPSSVAPVGEFSALWLGPDEWLLVGSPSTPAPSLPGASVVDLSAHRTVIEVAAPWNLLSHGCALDGVPVGQCAQTMVAQANVVIWALPGVYRLLVRASFARYLAARLDDASTDVVA